MKQHAVVLKPRDIAEFIEIDWRGPDTKDLEFAAALILARLHAKKFGGKHLIGFPAVRERMMGRSGGGTMADVMEILRTCIEEDTPLDFFIIPERSVAERRHKGSAYQLKRFPPPNTGDDYADSLLEYLNVAVPRKYSGTQATLVLLLGGPDDRSYVLDLGKVRRFFKSKNFPFHCVMFIGTREGNKFLIGEIWPNYGFDEYTSEDWFENDADFMA